MQTTWRLGVALLLLLTGVAHAEEPATAAVTAPVAPSRLQFLETRLNANQGDAALWWWTWAGILGGSVAVQGTAYFLTDQIISDEAARDKFRASRLVSTVASSIGFGSMIVPFYPAIFGTDGLPTDEAERLAAAEARLRNSADKEWFSSRWPTYAGSVIVGGGGSAVLWFYYGYKQEAVINLIMSWTVGGIKIWTTPTQSIADWEEYQSTYGLTSAEAAALTRPKFTLMPVVLPGGAGVRAEF